MLGHSDRSMVSIFHSMSTWFTQSSIQYWVNVRPLETFLCLNIPFQIRLIYTIVHWVFSMFGYSDHSAVLILHTMSAWQRLATPTIQVCQYSIPCSPDVNNDPFSIVSMLGHSNHSAVSIFHSMSTWLTQSSIQYWVNVRPIEPFLCLNILFQIRLIYTIIHSVFSMFGHFDLSAVLIFHTMSAWFRQSSIQYWINVRPLEPFLCLNIVFHVHLIYTIIHSIFSQCLATPTIPLY